MKTGREEEKIKRLNKIKEEVIQEENERNYRRLKKVCEEIKKNGKIDGGSFWEVKKKLERRKEENMCAVKNMKGKLVTTKEEICDAYKEYYEDLLTVTSKRTKTDENKELMRKVETKFNKIMEKGEKQQPLQITRNDIENTVKKLKRKKAKDSKGWNNEMVIEGGEEMIKSLEMMMQRTLNEEVTPAQWNEMIIKSIHKNRKSRQDLTNQRGLFLTNIMSKILEKGIEAKSPVKFDRFQNGGCEKRSTADNWIILMATIDEGKRLKKPVYIFFADLVKCFDRLWLKDCIIDLNECGMRERELRMIYKMNKEARIKIRTPAGETEEIKIEEIVKQGTIYGQKLCCSSTGKINRNITEEQILYPKVTIQATTYVDDIEAAGSRKFVEAVARRCKEEENEKLWEFSIEKTK